MNANADTLTEKIQSLTAEQMAEAEQFIEFIRIRADDRAWTRAAQAASSPSLEAVRDNPQDAAYDDFWPAKENLGTI